MEVVLYCEALDELITLVYQDEEIGYLCSLQFKDEIENIMAYDWIMIGVL